MWNYNIKQGSIWSVKSFNESNEEYKGMTYGTSYILILSAFTDTDNEKRITYLKVASSKRPNKHYTSIKYKDRTAYVELNELKTGNQKCLNKFIYSISFEDLNKVVNAAKEYFNLNVKKQKSQHNTPITDIEQPRERIHKFGIDIYVVPSDDVKIDDNKRLILSDNVKDDIIYNGATDDDILVLCNKYQIYPVKAIKELRYRLIYQHKHKQG